MYIKENGRKIRFFIDCGVDRNGKKIIKSKQISLPEKISKKEKARIIKEVGDEFERKVKGGLKNRYEKMRFRDFVSGMYETTHLCTLKEKTASEYRVIIRDRLLGYFGEMYLQDITTLEVRNWLSQLKRADGSNKNLSNNSKGVWFRTLSAILGKAEEWELIESNPCSRIKQPRKQQSEVKALEKEDVQKIFKGFEQYDDTRTVILIKILLLLGLRSSEVCGLEWRDIDFDNCTVSIEREVVYVKGQGTVESTPKSESSHRIVYAPKGLIDDLKEYKKYQWNNILKADDKWIGETGDYAKLFTQANGLPVTNFTILGWVKKYMKWCGVPYVTVHGLRHTYASLQIANSVDARTVAAQLGHSSPALVYSTYANPQKEAQRKAAELLESLVTEQKQDEE